VLPTADAIVIRAAYRALVQRYHPDKWEGSPQEAHDKMTALNEAYRVLSDPKLRAEYDTSRKAGSTDSAFFDEKQTHENAFSSALDEVEDRWKIACSVFPDLQEHRTRLARISTALAFSFVTIMLEEKAYARRKELSLEMEHAFLTLYFGTNPRIVEFARELIIAGNKKAAKHLNKLVDVLGSNVDPDILIVKVSQEHGMRPNTGGDASANSPADRERLTQIVKTMGYYAEARQLCELHGCMTTEIGGGLLRSPQIRVQPRCGEPQIFEHPMKFIDWVQRSFCS